MLLCSISPSRSLSSFLISDAVCNISSSTAQNYIDVSIANARLSLVSQQLSMRSFELTLATSARIWNHLTECGLTAFISSQNHNAHPRRVWFFSMKRCTFRSCNHLHWHRLSTVAQCNRSQLVSCFAEEIVRIITYLMTKWLRSLTSRRSIVHLCTHACASHIK